MSGLPKVAHEPFDRLTTLCDGMTDWLDRAVATEQIENPDARDVKAVVFLMDDEMGGIQTHGYDNTTDALVDLFVHLQAIFRSRGQDLEIIAVPPSPEGL